MFFLFSPDCILHAIPEPPLRPATAEEIAESLSFAPCHDGRRRVHTAGDAMARTSVFEGATRLGGGMSHRYTVDQTVVYIPKTTIGGAFAGPSPVARLLPEEKGMP
jgi:hypothetical protein